jgi:hypothetical protein
MATFQIPFGFAEEWHPSDREPLYLEQARALAREAETARRVTVALPPALSRSIAEAAASEGLTVPDWLVRVAARTVFDNPTAA